MKLIPVYKRYAPNTGGGVTPWRHVKVDDEDFDKLKDIRWYARLGEGRRAWSINAYIYNPRNKDKRGRVSLPRLVLNLPYKTESHRAVVIYADKNEFNCQKSNLSVGPFAPTTFKVRAFTLKRKAECTRWAREQKLLRWIENLPNEVRAEKWLVTVKELEERKRKARHALRSPPVVNPRAQRVAGPTRVEGFVLEPLTIDPKNVQRLMELRSE